MTQAASTFAGGIERSRPRGTPWLTKATPYLFLTPALIAVAGFVIYPIVTVAVESFFDVNPTKHEGWEFVGVQNYIDAAGDSEVWSVFGNSLIWTVGSVALQLVVAMAGALLLQQLLTGSKVLRAIFVLPWATPVVVGALAWRLLYQPDYGMINQLLGLVGLRDISHAWLADPHMALAAVVVANVWRGFPFIMVLLIAGMASIPSELYEAASVDGATWRRSFANVTLPLLKPMLMTSTLMALIWTFNNFSLIYVMTGGGPAGATDILTTFVYQRAFSSFDFGYASALSMILFAIVGVGSAVYIRAFGKESLS
ncbi:MAG TPA: sugar ABC transporter permease [Kribbella sp.]